MTKKSSIYEFSGCKGKTVKELLNGDVSVGRYFVCGGAGVCGACKAQIVSGELSSEEDVYSAGAVLRMCKSVVLSDNLRIMMPPKNSAQNSIFAEADFILPKGFIPESFSGLRAALDIGTTTLALVLFDASSRIIYRATSINPQCKYGADVVSRIAFAMSKEGINILRECISHSVAKMLDDALSFANADCVEALYVSGNCAMLHIFFGKEISGLATFPFKSDFLNSVECESFMGIKTKKIVSLPSIGAFVGADAVGACVNSGLFVKDCNSVMIDLGTNAEIVVKYKGQLFACSAPAGPAFEGGGFECSTKAQNGAICRVYIDGKPGLKYETIGNAPACGICASGYIDFLAEASHTGLISEFGAFIDEGKYYKFTDSIRIGRSEISELIKAKAAVQSALKTLFCEIGAHSGDFQQVYIAGGFGKGMNFHNAVRIGLLPSFDNAQINSIGNGALGGTFMCALSKKLLTLAKRYSEISKVIELNTSIYFQDNFIDALSLKNTNF